jgi:F0F1-type ATP synthase membrane subunit c/vacuolar-type H+-ATPase subunit K
VRAAWLICLKDLKARLRDRSALLIGIVVPLGLAFIFNSIFSGISGGSGVIGLGVVNADHGAASQQFTSQVLPAVSRSGLISVHTEPTEAQARAGGQGNAGRGHRHPGRLLRPGPGWPARLDAGHRQRGRARLDGGRPVYRRGLRGRPEPGAAVGRHRRRDYAAPAGADSGAGRRGGCGIGAGGGH